MSVNDKKQVVSLSPYESETVREQFERAYHSSYRMHEITRVIESPCGILKSYRCQRPSSWMYGFDVIINGATLVVTGDIGECMWKREMNMLDWFAKAFPDLHYLAGKVPHAIKTREFCGTIAEGSYRRRLEELGRLDEYEDFPIEDEHSYYETMYRELDDDDPEKPFDYTIEFVFCTAAVKWLIDKLSDHGSKKDKDIACST